MGVSHAAFERGGGGGLRMEVAQGRKPRARLQLLFSHQGSRLQVQYMRTSVVYIAFCANFAHIMVTDRIHLTFVTCTKSKWNPLCTYHVRTDTNRLPLAEHHGLFMDFFVCHTHLRLYPIERGLDIEHNVRYIHLQIFVAANRHSILIIGHLCSKNDGDARRG